MKKLVGFAAAALLLLAFAAGFAQEGRPPMPDQSPEFMKAVERGKLLWSDAGLGTTGKSCASCHADMAAFAGAARMYPKHVEKLGKVVTLDQMINLCITNPMKGKPLPWDDQRMADIVAYMRYTGMRQRMEGHGPSGPPKK